MYVPARRAARAAAIVDIPQASAAVSPYVTLHL